MGIGRRRLERQKAWAMLIEHSKSRDCKFKFERGANLQERLWAMKYQLKMSGGMLGHVAKLQTLVLRVGKMSRLTLTCWKHRGAASCILSSFFFCRNNHYCLKLFVQVYCTDPIDSYGSV